MRRFQAFGVLFLATLVVFSAAPATAQGCKASAVEFRNEFDGFIGDLFEIADEMDRSGFPGAEDYAAMVAELDVTVRKLSDDELLGVCGQITSRPMIMESTKIMIDAYRLLDANLGEGGCLSPTAHNVVFAAAWVAELVKAASAGVCDVTGCTIGDLNPPGVVTCVLGCIVAAGSEFVAASLQFGLALDDDCQLNDHMDLLSEIDGDLEARLDTPVSSLATALSVQYVQDDVSDLAGEVATNQTGINGLVTALGSPPPASDIASELASVSDNLSDQETDRQAFQELDLRLTIEAGLQPGETATIGLFQLPRSVGGKLEDVREVVASTITMHIDAGLSVNNALVLFRQADGQLNNGAYKRAFSGYRLAYQEAIRGEDSD